MRVLLLLLLLLPVSAAAHTGALAALDLRARPVEGATLVQGGWDARDFAPQGGLERPTLEGCEPAEGGWRCPPDLAGVTVVADLSGRDGQVVVTLTRGDEAVRGVLDPRAPAWTVPAPGEEPGLAGWIHLGLEHIAGGIDHLVFVLGLLLLVPGARALLGVVTAFTLGHSVTLATATLTGLAPASAPTEALIAGSILLLARELVVARREERVGRHPAGLAAVFGLVHGFGFSGALAEIGIPPDGAASALLGFNLGVELGQLGFVALLAAAGALLGRVMPAALEGARALLPWGIGALSGAWFLERVLALGG